MTCPFLREAAVKYCQTAAVRKMIPLVRTAKADEKCASAAHVECPVYRSQGSGAGGAPAAFAGRCQGKEESVAAEGPCPYLRESLMQYCAAAGVTKFVPYSESLLSRCGGDGYRYCELYLAMAHPPAASDEALPGWLRYSANHMWLDVGEGGACHVGIDGFLSRVLGNIERLSYVWLAGKHRPAAILTAAGADLEIVFPNPLQITGCNLYLRADPARLSAEPYTGGWLFEGQALLETANGLMDSAAAQAWLQQDERRLNEFLQQATGGHLAADGGTAAEGVATALEREQLAALFHKFFSPYARGEEIE